MLTKNQMSPEITTRSITGQPIDLYGMKGKKVLLKFHRFSGCPVAQREITDFIKNQQELVDAGIETIVFLHNSKEKVSPVFTELPGLHIIADRQKFFYKLFQAQFSWKALLSWPSWRVTMGSILKGYLPKFGKFQGGIIGIPADFLVDEKSRITALHYGRHFGDSWTVSDVMANSNLNLI